MKLNIDFQIKNCELKTCNICNESKELTEFYTSLIHNKHKNNCKDCIDLRTQNDIILNKKGNNYFVYIIINKVWSDYIKIGRTLDINKRLETYQTCSPHRDYEVYFIIKVKNINYIELYFKRNFICKNEWFKVDKDIAKNVINDICIKCNV